MGSISPPSPLMCDAEPSSYADPRKAVPFYRAFNNDIIDHLYSTDVEWVEAHIREGGFVRQGIAAYIFPAQEPNTQPLYRFYSATLHDHFYTTSIAERDVLFESQVAEWLYEGVAGYVFGSEASGGKPLYRLWSDQKCNHLYTVSRTERGEAIRRGYGCEGIVGYVYPASPV